MSTTTRRRRGNQTQGAAVPEELKELAAEVFAANSKMNTLKREHDKKRKELLAKMQQMGVKSFEADATVGRSTTTITAEIATPSRESIDVHKLRDLVDEDQFLDIVSATKKSVTDEVGGHVATQCAVAKPGTTNVNVKAKK